MTLDELVAAYDRMRGVTSNMALEEMRPHFTEADARAALARLRATEALVERAYHAAVEHEQAKMDPSMTWHTSRVKAALDKLRGGAVDG